MAKVLVVDDSALMRRLITQVVSDEGHEVRTARNGADAVAQVSAWEPDAITLDINMPEMDGLTALSLIMTTRPTPVLMVSSLTARGAMSTFEALALGAVDYVTKPGGTISLTVDEIREQLQTKLRAALRSRPRSTPQSRKAAPAMPRKIEPPPPTLGSGSSDMALVMVGVSTGGPRALEEILPQLPANFPHPVLVAQHMPAQFTESFARRLDEVCAMRVREVHSSMPLEPGTIYIARGGQDMVVDQRLGRIVAAPVAERAGVPWHPSVDVMVESSLKHLNPRRLMGVLLTGMGDDGARTMHQLHQQGGHTVAESERTSVVFGMPQELISRGGASIVVDGPAVAGQILLWSRTLNRDRNPHGTQARI
ncbi:MAG: chemotaxis-specific protein-glutamate methyltransferase CheB [Pseudomonadota bacterium]|jgi:two-component system chemotaxis response regulator CheB